MADSEAQINLSEISGLARCIADFWCSYECSDGDWDYHAITIIKELTAVLEKHNVRIPEYCVGCAFSSGEYKECDGSCKEDEDEDES